MTPKAWRFLAACVFGLLLWAVVGHSEVQGGPLLIQPLDVQPPKGMVYYSFGKDYPPKLVLVAFADNSSQIQGCENPNGDPKSISATGDWGWWQLNRFTWEKLANSLGYTWTQMLEPGPNTEVALAIWRMHGWSPWSCWKGE